MIPGIYTYAATARIYTYAATAIVAGALAFGAGWKVQEWRYGKQIADISQKHATALASANQKALDDTIKMQRTKDAAIQQAEQRAAQNAAAAAAARRTADGLRDTIYSIRADLPSYSQPAAAKTADTTAELLQQCADAFTGLAEKADRHAADALMLREAWPK